MGKVTYKQLADELGVSKDKIKYQARKLPPEAVEKVDGIVYLTEQGVAQIRTALGAAPESPGAPAAPPADVTAILKGALDTLQAQLAEKDALIQHLNDELAAERQHSREMQEKLATLVDQGQKLQALSAPRRKLLALLMGKKGDA